MTSEFAHVLPNWDIQEHLIELNIIVRRISFILVIMCVFWSFSIDNMITHWLGLLPLETGPNNENMSIYGPADWLQLRWAAVILLASLSLLPLISIQAYSFARPGLYPPERNWLISVLILTTTLIPILILLTIKFLLEIHLALTRPIH